MQYFPVVTGKYHPEVNYFIMTAHPEVSYSAYATDIKNMYLKKHLCSYILSCGTSIKQHSSGASFSPCLVSTIALFGHSCKGRIVKGHLDSE